MAHAVNKKLSRTKRANKAPTPRERVLAFVEAAPLGTPPTHPPFRAIFSGPLPGRPQAPLTIIWDLQIGCKITIS
jgi:hypothetical protein